ncbi:MAG: methyl-accepting chemotaxis protein [Methylococcales bacterium]|nr:methyl-accepting chemotaxis protein [Methylococcales bacterium]
MLKNLTVKAKLLFLIGLMSVIMLTLTGVNLYALNKTNQGLQTIYADRTLPLADLSEIKTILLHERTAIVTGFAFPEEMSGQHKKIEANIAAIAKLWDAYMLTYLTPEEKILAEKFQSVRKSFENSLVKAMEMQREGKVDDARKFYFETVRSLYTPAAEGIDALVQLQKNVAKEEFNVSQSRFHFMLIGSIVLQLFGIAISLFFGLRIVSRLLAELGGEPSYAAEIVRKIAHGELSTHVVIEKDDKSSLLYSIDTMRQTLSNIITSTSVVMKDVSLGELGTQLEVVVEGDFIQLKQSINETIVQLRVTLFALNDVMYAIYNADFSKVISGHVHGKFQETLDKAIQSQGALREMLKDVGQVMEHVAVGDINHRITAEGRGELLALKNNINNTLIALESLNEIEGVVAALAHGDLTRTITTQYPGVFGNVTTSLNNTVDNLKSLIGEIKTSSEIIASAANEISAGNNDLSHRTEEQAASLQETASSMEELSATVQQNTSNAKYANELAVGAAKTAKKGVAVVDEVVETMANINESSHQIVDIISVIDDIAFQTNILALNAAVEAARAGDQGKGFAVVAVEVRNLAQRAASAAGEIKRLISDSVDRISGGGKQVEQAGKTMEDIVGAIENVTQIMSDITKASDEQNYGIEQIHQAVTKMDEVTHQNAALVEEAAAAAESLSDQTRSLALEMANFKIK